MEKDDFDFIEIDDVLPEKGKDIFALLDNGDFRYCFRCNCHNPNCMEWRDSMTGMGLLVNVVKWNSL